MSDPTISDRTRPHTDEINDVVLAALARGEVPGCAEEEAEWVAQGRWPPPSPDQAERHEDPDAR